MNFYSSLPQNFESSFSARAGEALQKLRAGNLRHVEGRLVADVSEQRRKKLLEGQFPMATVLTCSDSRVVAEYIFDQSPGSLFVVKTAGAVLDDIVLASIEFGVAHLNTPLLVVLGHTRCGAVRSAVSNATVAGHLPLLIHQIQPALTVCKEFLHESVEELELDVARENTLEIAERLPAMSAPIQSAVEDGRVNLLGAMYDLATGAVDFSMTQKSHLRTA